MKRDSFEWMWIRMVVAFLLLGLTCMGAGERAQFWKLQSLPGAHRQDLRAISTLSLPEGAGERLELAAEDLIWVAKEAGMSLDRVHSGHPKQALILEVTEIEDEVAGAFTIRRERSRVYVRARSENGLLNALYAIAGDWFGARWYWAGDLGAEFVQEPLAKVPEGLWRETPAFVHRRMYPSDNDFGRRNRLVRRYSFNHNLAKIFDAKLFDREPEVFPVIQGRRLRPAGSAGTDPQPELTNPRTVEIAAEAAIAHFVENPESLSFSLSINDNVAFDESAWTESVVSPVQYFRQRPDYTNLVFGFMNEVAEQVFDEAGLWETPSREPRYLTALAYYWTEQSPVIPVHPRVMPVLTSDRAQWHDPAYRAEDRALIARWVESGAERVATWDYYFGAPYPYPRQFNQWMAESLKYLSSRGVDVLFSQLPSVWGMDGAKAWLAAELLWDPEQDVDRLLHEYYTNFFGSAAEPMREFYELAEAHRNAHEGKADWIKFYLDEAGIELMLPVLPLMRDCIQKAATCVAMDSRYAARIQVVSDAFKITELYADYYEARLSLLQGCLEDRPLGPLVEPYLAAREDFQNYAAEAFEDPMHKRLSYFNRLAQSDPMLLAVADLEDAPEDEPYRSLWNVAGRFARNGGTQVLSNPGLQHSDGRWKQQSFLVPALPEIYGWDFWFRPYQHFSVEGSAEGRGLRLSGADMCSFYTKVEVEQGSGYVLEFAANYAISPDNRSHLTLQWFDAAGEKLGAMLPLQFPNGTSAEPVALKVPLLAPESATQLRIGFLVSRQYEGDFLELNRVALHQVGEP